MKKRNKTKETVITDVDECNGKCRRNSLQQRKIRMKSEFFSSGFSEHWALRKITADNIKKFAFLVTLFLISYHGILRLKSDIKSCKWLLSDGNFHGFGNYRVWQPYGCMLHTYSKTDAKRCIRYIEYWGGQNRIAFIGDSRIRQLYIKFVNYLAIEPYEVPNNTLHSNLEYEEKDISKISIKFYWQPVINHSVIEQFQAWGKQSKNNNPNIVIIGSATHSIKHSNGSQEALEYYKKNLTILLPYMEALNRTTTVLWVLQDPIHYELLREDRKMITNELIDAYNRAATEILQFTRTNTVRIWGSARLVAQGYDYSPEDLKGADGLHSAPNALNFSIQILFNLYCNDYMNYNDGTCCSDPEKITFMQTTVLGLFATLVTLTVTVYLFGVCGIETGRRIPYRRYRWSRLSDSIQEAEEEEYFLQELNSNGQAIDSQTFEPQTGEENILVGFSRCTQNSVSTTRPTSVCEVLAIFARLGVILLYFFLCDRTNFFMKENKYFTRPNFLLPIAYIFALGVFFTDDSAHETVLHRDQTNEIKGVMQVIILAYHYTGASQVLPIYMFIRTLVSGYLFLSGFGHFSYFWNHGNVSFNRFCQVILRLNFLTIFLCLCMNRPYQFYYFVPLVTYWFVVMFVAFKIIPIVSAKSAELNSSHYFYMIAKLVCLISLSTILYTSEYFFEKIFLLRPWKPLFVTTDDSIQEWWFRWKIDRYSVIFGMTFAFAYEMCKKFNLLREHNSKYLFTFKATVCSFVLSLIGLAFYLVFNFTCRKKEDCNEVHPYLVFIPIVSFIVLRNLFSRFRSRYSLLFAWLGKISLELFICQYHIWLAADTHGILVLIPGYPVLNVVVTSFIFICIAHEIKNICERVLLLAIHDDWRYTLRNLAIVLVVLIPIAIKDGLF